MWTLEATGQVENWVLSYTADHGERMGAHGLMAKKMRYEEFVRVPLLISAPFRRS